MSENLGNLIVHLGLNTSQLLSGLNNAKSAMARAGAAMQRMGRNLTLKVSAPLAALGILFAKIAVDFQRSMRKINTLVGLGVERLNGMAKEVVALSNITGRASTELADALFVITSAGQRGAEAMQILERAARASAIGLGDTKEIARTVTAVLNAYGKENYSAARATDVLVGIIREGNLVAEELSPVLGRVIGLASQLGISFEEVGGSIATFTRLGVDAAEAVTGLRGIMNSLLKPSQQADEAFKSAGTTLRGFKNVIKKEGLAVALIQLVEQFEGNEEAIADIIPNVRALSAILGTAGVQAESYAVIMGKLNADLNHVDDGFKAISKDSGFKFEQTMQRLKNTGLELGKMLLPVVNKILDGISNLVRKFNALENETKALILTIAGIAIGIGPTLLVLGTLARLIGAITFPIAAVIVSIAVLVAAIIVIADNWDAIVERISDWSWWKNMFINMLSSITDWMSNVIKKVNMFLIAIGKMPIPNPFEDWTNDLEKAKDPIKKYKHEFVSMTESISKAANKAKKALVGLFGFGSPTGDILPTTKEKYGVTVPKELLPTGGLGLPAALPKTLSKVAEGFGAINRQVIELSTAVQNSLNTAFVEFGETLGNLFTGDAGASTFFQGLLGVVASFMKVLGQALITAGIAGEAFQNLFSIGGGVGAIVAGIALIAAAGVVRNLLKKGPQGLRSGGFVEQGGIFQLHRNEQVALPAGAAVTSAKDLGKRAAQSMKIRVIGKISNRVIKLAYDEESRVRKNTH